MAEPLFDPSLKKKSKKKKTVAFSEDPLGADADPTTPAPPEANGDLGPATVHEQMVQNGVDDTAHQENEDAELKAMFGDMKKKKKKKEIPLDLVTAPIFPQRTSYVRPPQPDEASGTSTPPAPASEEVDFADLKKKKKKKSVKKAAFDLEAFEKELGDAPPSDDASDAASDDGDLGDDPFAAPDGPAAVEHGREPWLASDRDYTYSEVRRARLARAAADRAAAPAPLLHRAPRVEPVAPLRGGQALHDRAARDPARRCVPRPPPARPAPTARAQARRSPSSRTCPTSASACTASRTTSSSSSSPSSAPPAASTARGASSSRAASSRSRSRTCSGGTSVRVRPARPCVLIAPAVEYVTCKTCKSPDTLLEKEHRIDFVSCQSCGSRRSVGAIKSGFKAQVGKRRRAG